MQEKATPGTLDEFQLRDELRALRTQIPDTPALNPIVNLAFDLSRRLEAGAISVEDLRALSTRLMDRACVHRARYLRERIGYVDDAETTADFTDFVAGTAKSGDFAAFKARWERARTGIVLTAHPTFGLSAELSERMAHIALAGGPENQIIGERAGRDRQPARRLR
jgi:phosphoenolpyruvate carboxylase